MSVSDGKKTLGVRGGGPRSGNVKQSFSHGRTKNVVVETKRKRVVVPKPGAANKGTGSAGAASGDPRRQKAGVTDSEMARRLKALQAAKAREADEIAAREAEEKARAEERERRRAEIEAKEREEREREEKARLKAEEEERKRIEAEEEAKRQKEAESSAHPKTDDRRDAAPARAGAAGAPAARDDGPARRNDRGNDRGREQRPARGKGRGGDDNRRSGKLTLNQALSGAEGGREKSIAAMRRKQERAR